MLPHGDWLSLGVIDTAVQHWLGADRQEMEERKRTGRDVKEVWRLFHCEKSSLANTAGAKLFKFSREELRRMQS